MVIVNSKQQDLLGSLVGERSAGAGFGRTLSCRTDAPPIGASRWESEGSVRVAPGTRLAFAVDVGSDEEVLWAGAQETGFTLRTSMAALCPLTRGTVVIAAEIYGPDGRLRDTVCAEVEVG